MDPSIEESTPGTEEPQAPTEPPPPTTVKRERTDLQKLALKKAREKALKVRAENAALKKREQEIEKQLVEKAKAERLAKIQEYEKEQEEPEAEPEPEPVKKKKKPARRVIVTEVSSGEETEEDVEVVLPKQKKSAQQLQYERTMAKMFTLS
jgi:pyruvate/2-oxoglutarate dehydrogenase complex dihydrolipoamide acyltransferase (E2) component